MQAAGPDLSLRFVLNATWDMSLNSIKKCFFCQSKSTLGFAFKHAKKTFLFLEID